MKRQRMKFKKLFEAYCDLDDRQKELFGENVLLPADKETEWREQQIKKITILEEMEKCDLCPIYTKQSLPLRVEQIRL